MPWSDETPTSLIVGPGPNKVVIATEVPAPLKALGITAAILFYFDDDTYFFLGTQPNPGLPLNEYDFFMGWGTSASATIVSNWSMGLNDLWNFVAPEFSFYTDVAGNDMNFTVGSSSKATGGAINIIDTVSGSPATKGGFLYSLNGALHWRSFAGTDTLIAPG